MALSQKLWSGDGVTTDFTVPFGYIAQSHVKVYIDNVLVDSADYSWPTSTTISFNTPPASGTENVLFDRDTPTDPAALTVFTDGNPTRPAANLNRVLEQAMYVAEETVDETDELEGIIEALEVSSGNVPTPANPTDNNKFLQANGGSFSWVTFTVSMLTNAVAWAKTFLTQATVADARAQLVAQEDVVTTAGDLVIGDGSGDASRLAIGTAGQILAVNSGATALEYQTQGGWTYVGPNNISADSYVEIQDLDQDSDHLFILRSVLPGTDGQHLLIQASNDAGASPTYDTGANYSNASWCRAVTSGAGAFSTVEGAANSQVQCTPITVGNVGSLEKGLSGALVLLDAGSADVKRIFGTLAYGNSSNGLTVATVAGGWNSVNAARALRFYFGAGTLSTGAIHHYKRAVQP